MSFLREHFNDNMMKVVDPLVKNVREHPMLLFSDPEFEKNQLRWKKPHDIVSEGEKLLLYSVVRSQYCEPEQCDTPWYGQLQVAANQIITDDRFKHSFAPISTTEAANVKQKLRSTNK